VRDIEPSTRVAPDRVLGHTISAQLQQDPGPRFQWYELAIDGVHVWTGSEPWPLNAMR